MKPQTGSQYGAVTLRNQAKADLMEQFLNCESYRVCVRARACVCARVCVCVQSSVTQHVVFESSS